jgi:hypothetical protein
MCGIFGIVNYSPKLGSDKAKAYGELTKALIKNSQIRGRDASGICLISNDAARVYKDDIEGSSMIGRSKFLNIIKESNFKNGMRSLIGHTRAQTKGPHIYNVNNHPIVANKVIGVHNGMIANDDLLFRTYKHVISREGLVDSEIIFRLIDMYVAKGYDLVTATKKTSKELYGSYVCAFVHVDYPDYLTLFSGDYSPDATIDIYKDLKLMVFASTTSILRKSTLEAGKSLDVNLFWEEPDTTIYLPKQSGIRINTSNGKIFAFDIDLSKSSSRFHHPWSGVYCL